MSLHVQIESAFATRRVHLFATVNLRILNIVKAILYLYFTTQRQSLYFFLLYICLTALVTTIQVIFLVTVALLVAWSLNGFAIIVWTRI